MKELAFRTNARHIGQLGRELVTDFVTALVELIKNSYDADAMCSKIIIRDAKKTSGEIIIADCGMGMTADEFENRWMVIGTSNKLSKPYTPKGRKKAGKKGIGRFSVERLAERAEIYSFPKDAPAFKVEIDWNKFEGLDSQSVIQRLEILHSRKDKEAAKFVAIQVQCLLLHPDISEAEKIDVISKIGSNYKAYTTYFTDEIVNTVSNTVLPLIEEYENRQQLMEDIKAPLVLIENLLDCQAYNIIDNLKRKYNPNSSEEPTGLVLKLNGLRDDWTQKDIDKLEKELRLLVAPDFLEKDPFQIELEAPEFRVEESVSVNSIVDASYAKVEAEIDNGGQDSYIRYRDKSGATKEIRKHYTEPLLCGNLTFELFYFLRDSEHLQLSGYNYRFATKVLDTYCGIKIYRDMFRVKPYGDQGNDWLYLDKAKVRDTHGYLVGNNQTIGRINISDVENPLLIDATNREGIIENEAFDQLREFIKLCIGVVTQVRKEEYEKKDAEKQRLDREHKKIQKQKQELQKNDDRVQLIVDGFDEALEDLSGMSSKQQISENFHKLHQFYVEQKAYQDSYEKNSEERYKVVQEVLDYRESELVMYKNLATLGMLAGEFGHETSDVINRVGNGVQAVIRSLRNKPESLQSVEVLNIVKKDFSRIASYSSMIIAFLRKKKRETCEDLDVTAVIHEVCAYYDGILSEFRIDLEIECESNLILSMRQIDLESIVINMLTNAYTQLKICKERHIMIKAWKEDNVVMMRFEDSGPGVPEKMREDIFKAFISSKEDGIGLGLNIVKDIVLSYNGTITCDKSELLGGACFAIDFKLGDEDHGIKGPVH